MQEPAGKVVARDFSFVTLLDLCPWKEILGCPGRWVVRDKDAHVHIMNLLKSSGQTTQYRVTGAIDRVWVLPLVGGGIISYEKDAEVWVHTLGDEAGFTRKLEQLRIV